MKKSTMYLRRFKCPECGAVVTAPKLSKTKNGHVKTMYCSGCGMERDFVQFEIDRVLNR